MVNAEAHVGKEEGGEAPKYYVGLTLSTMDDAHPKMPDTVGVPIKGVLTTARLSAHLGDIR